MSKKYGFSSTSKAYPISWLEAVRERTWRRERSWDSLVLVVLVSDNFLQLVLADTDRCGVADCAPALTTHPGGGLVRRHALPIHERSRQKYLRSMHLFTAGSALLLHSMILGTIGRRRPALFFGDFTEVISHAIFFWERLVDGQQNTCCMRRPNPSRHLSPAAMST